MILRLMISLIILTSTVATAQSIKPLACVKTGKANTQCGFQVTGQIINQPKAISNLYGMNDEAVILAMYEKHE